MKNAKQKMGQISLKIILAALFCLIFVPCFADMTQLQSALVWKQDGSGDYLLPKVENGEYNSTEIVASAGEIKSICVNYQAQGKVKLEVSVDNGLHFYAVVNGVPLTSGFVSGDRIKWRAKILSDDGALNALSISYADNTGVVTSFGEPTLSGFNYRKEILLKNPGAQELFDYQVKLLIGETAGLKGTDLDAAGKIKKDFSDLRFTSADGLTPLAYYKEGVTGASPKQIATIWVRVPQIPKTGVKIYLYYNNLSAVDLSSAKNTFDFYDNFESGKLDANVWESKIGVKGSVVMKDGKLKLDAAEIMSKQFKFNGGIIEYSLAVESGFENSLNLRAKSNEVYENPSLIAYSSAYKDAEHCIALDDIVKVNDAKAVPIAAGGKYNYRFTANEKEVAFERFDGASGESQAKVNYSDNNNLQPGYLGIKSGGEGSGRNVIAYSGIRVRKFADLVPEVEKAGAEEQVKLAIFSNIALSPKGNLVLVDLLKEGTYVSETLPVAFGARIIVPTFKGDNVSLDISADNGANYKKGVTSGSYYYASLKDFNTGTNIVAQVKLGTTSDKKDISQLEELKLNYSPGTLLLVKPNGGEILGFGTAQEIVWSALDYESSYPLKLEYSLDGGKNYSIIADKVSNSGSYAWQIGQEIKTQTALIRISDSNAAEVNDLSDKVFTIQESGLVKEEVAKEVVPNAAEINQIVAEAKDDIAAEKQTGANLNDLNKDYVIDKDVIISTEADIAFKTLTLGDGAGKHISKLILHNNINPNSGKIVIRFGGQLIQANNTAQEISGDLLIEKGGILTHLENKAENKYQVNLTANNIVLTPGAIVSVYAKGYNGGAARQAGTGKAGGKYIGKSAGGGKHTYDSVRMPKELGSGGAGSLTAKGGAGGGVINLVAKKEFSLSGIINADGKAGAVATDGTNDGAGGAGGSIYLGAEKFSGSNAKITATGGSGNKTGGAGGGGRIHIKAPAGKINGTINANGGSGKDSGAGSVILE